jgi:hypothetical protein
MAMPSVLTNLLQAAVLAAALAFWAFTLVDLMRSDARNVRGFRREVWLVLVIFGSVVGCLAWWAAGRPRQG